LVTKVVGATSSEGLLVNNLHREWVDEILDQAGRLLSYSTLHKTESGSWKQMIKEALDFNGR